MLSAHSQHKGNHKGGDGRRPPSSPPFVEAAEGHLLCVGCEHWAYLNVEMQDMCLVESQDICLVETQDMCCVAGWSVGGQGVLVAKMVRIPPGMIGHIWGPVAKNTIFRRIPLSF